MVQLLFFIAVIVYFCILSKKSIKINELALRANQEWIEASKRLNDYERRFDETSSDVLYSIPTSVEEIDSDSIYKDRTYLYLKREEIKAYIFFLETHPFCIHAQDLILLLSEITDEELYQKVLRMIFFDKAPQK